MEKIVIEYPCHSEGAEYETIVYESKKQFLKDLKDTRVDNPHGYSYSIINNKQLFVEEDQVFTLEEWFNKYKKEI